MSIFKKPVVIPAKAGIQSRVLDPGSRQDDKKKTSKKKRVLIALSGGIDSAVSAHLLLKQGYEVEAAFMKNWSKTEGLKYDECPWLTDRQDALRVAAFLKIPLHTLDFEKQYAKQVMNYFFKEYSAGRTPNPDVMCNKEIKFKLLYDWAMKNGFEYMATGHYAQIKVTSDKRQETSYELHRSKDEFKDQTYFIYNIKPEQLPHILFPIGAMKKTAVRQLAKKIKLPNADKAESMGLCFVGKIRLKDFLEQKLKSKTGPITDQDNQQIGEHQGLYQYTIGQRQGIRVGANGPYYVTKKDLQKNALYVTNDPQDEKLFVKEIEIHSVNWISEPTKFPMKLSGRFRHQGDLVNLTVHKPRAVLGRRQGPSLDVFRIVFDKRQKAIASGQSLVLYKGTQCLGGGVII
jgi:tRNA-uridine 2-sulfurtransferase